MSRFSFEDFAHSGAIESPEASGGERLAALRLLLSRHSISPRHLGPPGPSDDELLLMAGAALRAPDHEKLVPFRFVVSRDEGLERLAALFEEYGRRRGRAGEELDAERARALQAPVTIAVIARIDNANRDVPEYEQWVCVGGAIANAVNALHVMGYAAKVVSGARASDPAIRAAYCGPDEFLVGWMSTGTPRIAPTPRGSNDPAGILSRL